MTRRMLASVATVAAMVGIGLAGHASAQRADLAGRWTLNRSLSQFPNDIGFGMDLLAGPGGDTGGGGRGHAAFPSSPGVRESEDDARRRDLLVEEARDPSPHLTIVQTATAVTITDDAQRSRTFHPDGREESQTIAGVPVVTTSRWVGPHLEVLYKVQQNRELRYTFSRTTTPKELASPQLVVQLQFVERGGGASATRIYEPATPNEPPVTDWPRKPAAPPWKTPPPPGLPANAAPPAGPPSAGAPPTAPPAGATSELLKKPELPAAQGLGETPLGAAPRPDAEFKGLRQLGLVVEQMTSQAAGCGLTESAVESAVSKSLSDVGLKVVKNSDEDTYLDVQILTTSVSAGLCVSRYDVALYSYTTARLSYLASPLLLQVTLARNGGLTGGAPAIHGGAVVKAIKQDVDELARRIANANR